MYPVHVEGRISRKGCIEMRPSDLVDNNKKPHLLDARQTMGNRKQDIAFGVAVPVLFSEIL